MADEKLNLTDLRKTISKQMSLPEETASKFLAALFPTIIEGLKKDKSVRISGLGIFKLVWVAPRKSVNINTGESIMLEGYNKLTFLPESYIREQINEPFAGLEAVRVDENGQPLDPQSTLPGTDPLVRFGKQADEIKGILADLGQDTEFVDELPAEDEVPEVEKTPKKPIDKPVEKPVENSAEKPLEKRKPFRGWVVAVATIVVLLVMLVVGYFVLVNKLENWADSLGQKADVESIIEPEEEAEVLDLEPLQPMDSIAADSTVEEVAEHQEEQVEAEASFQPSLLAVETVKSGSRLAQISRKYYGSPDYWEVIYEANKDVIDDPNHLRAGVKLRIPKLQ